MAEGGAQRSAAEATARLRSRMEVSRILVELPKPTIAMINGPAAGAGLALALACDLRIAGASARLVTAFVSVGFSGDFGGSFSLTRLVGTARARELYFTGRPVEADEALSLGLINRVVARCIVSPTPASTRAAALPAYRSFRMIHQHQPADPGERARRGTARGGISVLLDDPCGVDLDQPA